MAQQRRVATVVGAILGTFFALLVAVAEGRAEVTEQFHQSYTLNPGGSIELHNVNGDVRITAWDRNEVKVDAVKTARTKERVDEAQIVVEATGDRVFVKTQYPEHDLTFSDDGVNNPAIVEYTLMVPRSARLNRIEVVNGSLEISGVTGEVRASCVNGKLTAKNLAGDSHLSSVNSGVEANFVHVPSRLVLTSVNGTVELTVPSDVNAEVSAKTVNGAIDNDFGLHVHHGRYVGHDLRGQIGSGGAHIDLENVNGIIDLRHASDGKRMNPVKSFTEGDDEI
jgi:DUF4097 and DUF4098 domain-containing protein YvlB